MKKDISLKNRDRLVQLGIVIASLRRVRGLSQEQLAEKANISRAALSLIETPNMVQNFSLDMLYNIADALEVSASDLLNASLFSEEIKRKTVK